MAKITGDTHLQTDVLENLSDAVRYRQWLAELARPYLGTDPIEIGAGNGDYALEWLPYVSTFTATEADEYRFKGLHERFTDNPAVDVRWLLLGDESPTHEDAVSPSGQHTAAVAFNVFEHIPDDVAALKAMAQFVRPGGNVVIIVPAFPSAMSRFDRAIGHQRRYTKASLRTALCDAGLDVTTVRYVNPLGLLAWYVAVKTLNITPSNGWSLRLYDRTIVPIAKRVDRLVPSPFGQGVLGIARVPAS